MRARGLIRTDEDLRTSFTRWEATARKGGWPRFVTMGVMRNPKRPWRYRFDRNWEEDASGRTTFGVPCKLWTGAVNPSGYGVFWLEGRLQLARRIAWVRWREPIPDGRRLRGLCGNRACIEPNHMRRPVQTEGSLRVPGSQVRFRGDLSGGSGTAGRVSRPQAS